MSQQNGLWDRFLDKTSKDGFNHQQRRNQIINERQAGNWENLQNKTSASGFTKQTNLYATKARTVLPKDHFEKGQMIVQVNDEGGLWNRKPMIKHNNNVKKSHAFDAFKLPPNQKELNERYNYLYKNNANYNNAEIQKANYERFYKMDGNQGDNGKSEYRQNYLNKEQDQFQQSKKLKSRPALPTPKYMQDLIQYKREHNVLNN